MRAVLTRDSDFSMHLSLYKSAARAVRLFLSIHADGSSRTREGLPYLSCLSAALQSTQARLLAQRENDADLVDGVNLGAKVCSWQLLGCRRQPTINDSLKLGKYLLGELGGVNTLHKNNVGKPALQYQKRPIFLLR